MSTLDKSVLASLVGISPRIVAALLRYLLNNGMLGEPMEWNYNVNLFISFLLSIIPVIAFFWIYRIVWKKLSKNDNAAHDDFRWWHAIVIFIGIFVLKTAVMFLVNSSIWKPSVYLPFVFIVFLAVAALYATLRSRMSSLLKSLIGVGLLAAVTIMFCYYIYPFVA